MHSSDPNILITGEIDETLLKEIAVKRFNVDLIPFIKTEVVKTEKIQQQIEDVLTLNTTVVFTSSNAVEAVHTYLQNKRPNWKIYSIGNSTGSLVKKLFNDESLIAVAGNAGELATKIIADKNSIAEVYFFCGDKRREELPVSLAKNNIAVTEVEVYTTTILRHKIEKDYDGILFFSPSAVEGFFSNNVIHEKTVLFAIGNTTAREARKFSKNEVVTGDKPEKKSLVVKMMSFFGS